MFLIWTRGSDVAETAVLELGTEPIRIGRGTKCDVRVSDSAKGVSRVHCVIEKERANWRLLDYSTNGTFVNGQRVQERLLKDGDKIIVGPVTITFASKRPHGNPRGTSRARSALGDDTRSYTAILRETPVIRNPYSTSTREEET
jgi:pSer/pThr/pTyr-binding forkhead associated (FHA) protein